MYVNTPDEGYWLSKDQIKICEDKYQAKYMGYWAIRNKHGQWSEQPAEVFYQPAPDVSKGHSKYFGIFRDQEKIMICNAESAFKDPITGVLTETGEVLVSRYRHDYVSRHGCFIDGGRDYIKTNSQDKFVTVQVKDDLFEVANG